MNDQGPQLRLTLPARSDNVIVVRQAVSGLGEAVSLPDERLADLKTIVTEACNNVVLHAYPDGEEGPLEVSASIADDQIQVVISDQGQGFTPRADSDDESLGLGLPLIAALSDTFEISGGAGQGTRTSVRLAFEAPQRENGGGPIAAADRTELAVAPGQAVRPVLARVIGALASRAEFSLDRLADSVLLGDAVSSRGPDEFAEGLIAVSIEDGDGTLDISVGPLVEGGAERLLRAMEIPAGERGSLRKLARDLETRSGETADGRPAEYLVFEVAR
jgi:anti-sigma regulatory factor (Ser/Thr protein kinase)